MRRLTVIALLFFLAPAALHAGGADASDSLVCRILADAARFADSNNPDRLPNFHCEAYSKVKLQLSNVKGRFGTLDVNGRRFIPNMISETVLDWKHELDPVINEEVVLANRISGMEDEENMLSQFTGSRYLKADFFKPYINIFNASFPSPFHRIGKGYYRYVYGGAVMLDGRKTHVIHFSPRMVSPAPSFTGCMYIDDATSALRKIHAGMVRRNNPNWISSLEIDSDFKRLQDGRWFYDKEMLQVELSPEYGGPFMLFGVAGVREVSWKEPHFDRRKSLFRGAGPVSVAMSEDEYDEAWWEKHRAASLTPEETETYGVVDSLLHVRDFSRPEKASFGLTSGCIDYGVIGFGPILKSLSFNPTEAVQLRLGLHTTPSFSKTDRLSGFLAYGVRDKEFKGGLTYEHVFSRNPTAKLTIDGHYDEYQLGIGKSDLTSGNLLCLFWSYNQKMAPMSSYSVKFEQEYAPRVNAELGLALKRYYSNAYVPMFRWDGESVGSVASNEAHLGMRFSWGETVNRGLFDKSYVHTESPVLSIDLTGSLPGIRNGDYGFFKPEASMYWKLYIPPVGVSDIRLSAGTILGKVPWPMLNLFNGNATWIMDRSAFSCMDYFEFASDSWATLLWYHNFHGAILGLIPGVRSLGLREDFIFKMACSSLRDCNDGSSRVYGAVMQFPEGMREMGDVPYIEIGTGISNIFRIVSVDFIWRLTHKEKQLSDGTVVTAGRPFTVNIGVDLTF